MPMWRTRPADELSRYWAAQKLPVRLGAPRETVRQFETTHNVSLPTEVREYFLKHDGMSSDSHYGIDKAGFSLWELARVRPAAEELSSYSLPVPEGHGLDESFAFADYLDWSWAYAIRLTANPREGRVVMIGTADHRPLEIASSFGEFVALLVRDSPRLYPAAPEKAIRNQPDPQLTPNREISPELLCSGD